LKCTLNDLPDNPFGLQKVCMDGKRVILFFDDSTSASSVFREEFLAKEVIKGANRRRTYETYNAPLTEEMKERGISDLRIEENAVENLILLILEASRPEESVTLQLAPGS